MKILVQSFIAFILISLATGPVNAMAFRCERLFLTFEQIHKAKISIAKFRLDIWKEKNPKKKDLLIKEFKSKFDEFADLVGNSVDAKKMMEDMILELETQRKRGSLNAQILEKEKSTKILQEQEIFQKWTRSISIKGYQKNAILRTLLSPDGTKLITITTPPTEIKILDLNTLESSIFQKISDFSVGAAEMSLDGSKIFLGGKKGNPVKNVLVIVDLNAKSSNPISIELGDFDFIKKLYQTPDGKFLIASIISGWSKVFDLTSMTNVQRPPSSISFLGLSHLSFSPDGKKLVRVDSDGQVSTSNVLQLEAKPIDLYKHRIGGNHSVISLDGSLLVTSGNDGARFFDLIKMEEIVLAGAPKNEAVFSIITPDSSKVIVGYLGGEIDIIDLRKQEVKNIYKHRGRPRKGMISPDGSILVTLGDRTEVKVYNFLSDQETHVPFVHVEDGIDAITDIAMTQDGSKIIAVDMNGQMEILFRDMNEAKKFESVVP